MREYKVEVSGTQVRAYEIGGEVYFPISDTCRALGIKKNREISKRLNDYIRGDLTIRSGGKRTRLSLVRGYGAVRLVDKVKRENIDNVHKLFEIKDAILLDIELGGVTGEKLQLANRALEKLNNLYSEGLEKVQISDGEIVDVELMLTTAISYNKDMAFVLEVLGDK